MSKKSKKRKNLQKFIIELLIAVGTVLTGIANLIQALKQRKGAKAPTSLAKYNTFVEIYEEDSIQTLICIISMGDILWIAEEYLCKHLITVSGVVYASRFNMGVS